MAEMMVNLEEEDVIAEILPGNEYIAFYHKNHMAGGVTFQDVQTLYSLMETFLIERIDDEQLDLIYE